MFGKLFKSDARKTSEKQMKMLEQMIAKEKVINTFVNNGLLFYDAVHRRLFIATALARVYLDKPERWKAFMENIHNWALYRRQSEAWKDYFLKVELQAVRKAKKKYAVLTPADIQRIRQEARMKVDVSEVETPKVEPFEFFISDISAETKESDILVVGKYDGTKCEMAAYDDVRRFMEEEKN